MVDNVYIKGEMAHHACESTLASLELLEFEDIVTVCGVIDHWMSSLVVRGEKCEAVHSKGIGDVERLCLLWARLLGMQSPRSPRTSPQVNLGPRGFKRQLKGFTNNSPSTNLQQLRPATLPCHHHPPPPTPRRKSGPAEW